MPALYTLQQGYMLGGLTRVLNANVIGGVFEYRQRQYVLLYHGDISIYFCMTSVNIYYVSLPVWRERAASRLTCFCCLIWCQYLFPSRSGR